MTTLLMTMTPPVAAAIAWPVLIEPLTGWDIVGIAVTLAGIVWVVRERREMPAGAVHQHRVRGLLFGTLAAVCQAVGLILSKLGIGHDRLPDSSHLDPWSASLIRLSFGSAAICILAALHRAGRSATAAGSSLQYSVDPDHLGLSPVRSVRRNDILPSLGLLTAGAILGPVVGVWCSLVAIDRAPAGVAATLMATTPLIIVPFAIWIERERISWRAIIGAAIAVAGIGILTLAPE